MIDMKDEASQELLNDCEDDLSQIEDFFEEVQYANIFSQLFLYSKQKNGALELDVRDSIIGVKAVGERLRYYSTKRGILRIKISEADTIKSSLLDIAIEKFYLYLDQADQFFLDNKADITVKKVTESISDSSGSREHEFYAYIEECYRANHNADGKEKRAPKHAQKCIVFIRELNTLLKNEGIELDMYGMTNPADLMPVYRVLKKSKERIQESDLKWYYYVLKRYSTFLENGSASEKNPTKEPSNISNSKQKLIDALELEINNLFAICHSCFIVDSKLYSRMSLLHKQEMQTLGKKCSVDVIFRICKCAFANKFYFSKPYILKERVATIGNDEFVSAFVQNMDEFTLSDINLYIDNMHLKRLTSYLDFMCACSDNYVQVDKERMISKNRIALSSQFLEQLKHELQYYIESFGPIDSEIYMGYNSLPIVQYPWSKYLLLGIVRSYFLDAFSIYYRDKSYNGLSYLISDK